MCLVRRPQRDGGGLGQSVLEAGLFADAGLARTAAGGLSFAGADVGQIASEYGTPAYVYAADVIQRQYATLDRAFASVPHRIHYAVKANGNLAVLRLFRDLGAGADIVSGGELSRALSAGFSPDRIVFSGVGKRLDEIESAVAAGVGAIHVESLEELTQLGEVAERLGRKVRFGIRFNPDVSADTHPFISTGQSGIKFGVPADQAGDAIRLMAGFPRLELVTIAIHIGSQLLDVAPYREAVGRLIGLLEELRGLGIGTITALDIGGGMGIRYAHEQPLEPAALAEAVTPLLRPTGLAVHLEPGRYLVGASGLMLARVLYRKQAGGKVFIVLDAGMTELVRPSRYGAYHHIVPVTEPAGPPEVVDVVGPVCETGDFLALDRPLPPLAPGDVVAVLGSGAYGFVMASQYNARPRPPEILVEAGRSRLVRSRETMADLLRGEE